jgi:hypothetical protein
MYVTYDLPERVRNSELSVHPRVKRVTIAGEVKHWEIGHFTKRSGKQIYGLKIEYMRNRSGYTRRGYSATRGDTEYQVPSTQVEASQASISKIIEVPEHAQNVQLRTTLPKRYQEVLQDS